MRKKLQGTVKKVIKLPYSKEKAEIDVHEAEDLYREIRVDNDIWMTQERRHRRNLEPRSMWLSKPTRIRLRNQIELPQYITPKNRC